MFNIDKSKIKRVRVSEDKEWKTAKEYLIFLRHKRVYLYAKEFCKDKNVLDYGCGAGYGTTILSKVAKKIIGIDIDKNVINICKAKYKHNNLIFQNIDSYPLPFDSKTFDVIVSFHVIEHFKYVSKYLNEIKRILKDDGVLIITTPNRKYRLLPFQKPWNPEHFREYSSRTLKRELTPVFNKIILKGIYGNEEINVFEYRRMIMLRNPFMAYIYTPCIQILEKFLPSNMTLRLEQKFAKLNVKNKSQYLNIDLYSKKFSIEDFGIGNNFKKSLDLLAICRKK